MAGGDLPALTVGGLTLGLREGVIILIGLVALYILFVLLRMRRLQRPPTTPRAPAAPSEPVASQFAEPVGLAADEDAGEVAEAPPPGLAEEMLRRGLELEIAQLRDEVDALRGELAALRDDLQQEMAHVRAAQSVSPIYGDAMQMAVAGYDPAMIAERCGIARAEAELVVALAKNQGRGGNDE